MQINEMYVGGDYCPLECPEDSVFFPLRIEDNNIILPVLIGDSNNMKHYIIRSVSKYMTFMEDYISIQSLGYVDFLGSGHYIFAMEKE